MEKQHSQEDAPGSRSQVWSKPWVAPSTIITQSLLALLPRHGKLPRVCVANILFGSVCEGENEQRGEKKKKSGARRFEEETTNDQRRLQTAKEL